MKPNDLIRELQARRTESMYQARILHASRLALIVRRYSGEQRSPEWNVQ